MRYLTSQLEGMEVVTVEAWMEVGTAFEHHSEKIQKTRSWKQKRNQYFGVGRWKVSEATEKVVLWMV